MSDIYLGGNQVLQKQAEISGQFVEIEGEKFYQIRNYHLMPDFLIILVSDSDHWMYLSSTGSLAAGRKNRDNALFPYYTDDKIHDYEGKTGSKTYFLVNKEDKRILWEPFSPDALRFYDVERNIYKSIYGNKVIFEEKNLSLGLSFRYGWYNSEAFGFVKRSSLENLSDNPVNIRILDGLKNILPHGLGYAFQNEYSNLARAYKISEKAPDTTLGLFMLSAIPVDRAEPSEALCTTTVWSTGFREDTRILISEKQVGCFLQGKELTSEHSIRAHRGAYFILADIELQGIEKRQWLTIAEINQSHGKVINLNTFIRNNPQAESIILRDIQSGTSKLIRMVALSDGFQISNTEMCSARHYTNTLFNIMRGGLFVHHYRIDREDFSRYTAQINRLLSKQYEQWLAQLPSVIDYEELLQRAAETKDADLIRIASEYLPLSFSRRHGDPSRPWNQFSIETKNEDGSIKYSFQGNWRDIFQNWEALCYAFPSYIEGIISKFVNASTIDGYNPYRIRREGIDWEVPDPNDPWAYIGYWGDHQIIYLLRFLELSSRFHPGKLEKMMVSPVFTYANVPYRIKPYEEILRNPKDTVAFDFDLDRRIRTEMAYLGADACLLKDSRNTEILKVNLTEKLLVSLLSKICNFIPEAGIWLNTQRPEWNDANNALVGNGASMVTLYYLRRFVKFWQAELNRHTLSNLVISEELAALFDVVQQFLNDNVAMLSHRFSDADRLRFANFLGKAHAKYRNEVYQYSFSGEKRMLQPKDLEAFLGLCLQYFDHSIRANRREDALFHTYNLISIKPDGISIRHLYEMLEGQVAILSAEYLSGEECLALLNALKKSRMFREDQYSYMLYPDRVLPGFMEKNKIPPHLVDSSALLKKLLADKNQRIIEEDILGQYHFNANFRNAELLDAALAELRVGTYSHLIESERDKILAIYEEVFDHQSFTGRSGTFFGYEGLGSIYWHMVSKLMLATQECFFSALDAGAGAEISGELKAHYYEMKAGIGLYKNPGLYGAFPMDAHSHTPAGAGVKQPGLTGQVKEDIISRLGELALTIEDGVIRFRPELINEEEFLVRQSQFKYLSINGETQTTLLLEGQIAFTFCQVPVILTKAEKNELSIYYPDGTEERMRGLTLSKPLSTSVFRRKGEIDRIEVFISVKQDLKQHT